MSDMAIDYERRPITVDEYHWLGQHGFFGDDERVELLDGQLIRMAPLGWKHAGAHARVAEAFILAFAGRAIAHPAGAVILSAVSEPQPDLMLLAGSHADYVGRLPCATDVALAVEIADSTLRKDRLLKAALYARARVREYWIVNGPDDCVEIHRQPRDGGYASFRTAHRGESIAPEAFADDAFAVEDLLPLPG